MSRAAALVPPKTPRSAFAKLMESEAKMAWRLPIGLVAGVVIPILLVVIFGSLRGMNHPEATLGGLTYFDVYFPVVIVLSVAILALVSLPTRLANFREQGILRRLSTTPVPPSWMLAAQLVINLAMAVVGLGVVVIVATTAYSLGAPRQLAGFVLALLLTIAAMFAIGLWVASFARSAGVANGVGQLILYPLWFFAGLWIPLATMTPVLRDICGWTPLGAAVKALQASMQGTFPSATSLLVMAGWAAVFGFLAVRFFRWE
jgi:ABC-2 type transport system permease protein